MFKLNTTCRACGFGNSLNTLKHSTAGAAAYRKEGGFIPALDLGLQPLANDFCSDDEERCGYAPLQVVLCPKCGLAQLSVIVNPKILYAKYHYVTSDSKTMLAHFDALWSDLSAQQPLKNIMEIGSNNGALLRYFKQSGAESVLGIDPAENLAKEANADGITTLCSLFDGETARMANATMPEPDLVIARHVFCHIHDWQELVHNLSVVCAKKTLVAIEVPYVVDQIDNCSWDQIYHEHLSYLHAGSFLYLLHGSALKLEKVFRYSIHGGSIVLLLRRLDHHSSEDPELRSFIEDEKGKCGVERWASFADKAKDQIVNLKEMVKQIRNFEGHHVVGYGASAKATVWINACGFTNKHIDFICDSTKSKQYRKIPGTNIPVVDPGAITRELPKYAVCFAWNFFSEIYEKENIFRDKGGRWIVPVPEVKIV